MGENKTTHCLFLQHNWEMGDKIILNLPLGREIKI